MKNSTFKSTNPIISVAICISYILFSITIFSFYFGVPAYGAEVTSELSLQNLSSMIDPDKLYQHNRSVKIAVSGDHVYVVWEAFIYDYGPWAIFLARSEDGGRSFLQPQKLMEKTYDDGRISIELTSRPFAAEGSNVHLLYMGDDGSKLYYLRSTDYGATFDEPLFIAESNNGIQGHFLSAEDNKVVMAWASQSAVGSFQGAVKYHNSIMLKTSIDGGLTFDEKQVAYDNQDWEVYRYGLADMALSHDAVYLLSITEDVNYYTGQVHLYLWGSSDGGKTFNDSVKVNQPTSADGYYLWNLQDANYTPHLAANDRDVQIVWINVDDPGGFDGWAELSLRTVRSTDYGATLEAPVTLYTYPSGYHHGAQSGLEGAVRLEDKIAVFAVGKESQAGTRVWISENSGVGFSEPLLLSYGGWWPQAAFDGQSNLHITNSYYYLSRNAGKTFLGGVNPHYLSGSWDYPQLVVDSEGTAHYVACGAGTTQSHGDASIQYRRLPLEQPLPGDTDKSLRLSNGGGDQNTWENIQIPASSDIEPHSALSVEFWYKWLDGDEDFQAIRKSRQSGKWAGTYEIGVGYGGFYARMLTENSTNGDGEWLGSSVLPELNKWIHIAMTYDADGGDENWQLYIDGVQVAKATLTGNLLYAAQDLNTPALDAPLIIGNLSQTSHTSLFDTFRLWNRALSRQEIVSAMNTVLIGNENGLVTCLSFDDTLKDLTGRHNDGLSMLASTFSTDSHPTSQLSPTIVLTDALPNLTINAGTDAQVYGTASSNQIFLESGAKAKLLNFPGSNIITINTDSNQFTVSRSGAYVTFEGTDNTVLKIPATLETQTIAFNDESWTLVIDSGKVMLGYQEISLTPSAIH